MPLFSSVVFASTRLSTVCACSPVRISTMPSTASFVPMKPNWPSRGAWPMTTSPTSFTRTGVPLCTASTMLPMSSSVETRPSPRT